MTIAPNQHQRGTQTTRGAIASGFKSALACVVGAPTSYDHQHNTRLRAGGFFLVKLAGRYGVPSFSHRNGVTVCECGDHAFRPFVRGSVVLVDVEDAGLLSLHLSYTIRKLKVYALLYFYPQRHLRLHRILANAPKGVWVDHANRNTTDNRKKNLRVCTPAQNAANRAPKKGTLSGMKGVFPKPRSGHFEAAIYLNGLKKYLGTFETAELAHAAYRAAAVEIYGEFARFRDV